MQPVECVADIDKSVTLYFLCQVYLS